MATLLKVVCGLVAFVGSPAAILPWPDCWKSQQWDYFNKTYFPLLSRWETGVKLDVLLAVII